MLRDRKSLLIVLAALTAIAGCAGPSLSTTGSVAAPPGVESRSGPKRVTVAIPGNPFVLNEAINDAGPGGIRGVPEVEKLINAGLVIRDGDGNLQPQLAETVPNLDYGTWRVLDGGRMETTWTIRQGAQWHDGTPVTTADLAFTLQAGQDKDLALLSYPGYKSIEGIDIVDDRTATVRWREPFIAADTLFSHEFALPMPRHLLEQPYLTDKSAFVSLPFWTTDYVGSGPFKLREFVRDSSMVVDAFDPYVLGRPKLDQLEVRFIQDPNALIASVLAGEVEVTLGRGFNLEQLTQAAGLWQSGKMEAKPGSWIAHYPQALTPNPAVLGDARFRRALLQAIDRQQLSDTLQEGRAPVADSLLEVGDPQYKEIESSIVRYAFDPRQAMAAIEDLGYAKGSDGFFTDSNGQRLTIESRTNVGDDLKEKLLLATADYWQRIGVGVSTVLVPRQQADDREYRATFPGFDLVRQPFDPQRLLSSEAAVPANHFNGKNRTRYMNPELDGYIDRYLTTIPHTERIQALAGMVHLISDQVVALGIFYAPEPMLIGNRLVNLEEPASPVAHATWNANQWDVR